MTKNKKQNKTLQHRATMALNGYKAFLVEKKLLSSFDANKLTFEEHNVKPTWKNVVRVLKADGSQYPNANKVYQVSTVPHGSRGYTLKGFTA